jgi:hypothetical protein
VFVCGTCGGPIDLSDPDVVYAVMLRESLGFLETDLVEGAGVYSTTSAFPGTRLNTGRSRDRWFL